MYTLRLLGGVTLEGEDGPLAGRIIQRRRLALLALLAAARGRPVSRDKLIAYLWPESSPERARHSLADALYLLRRRLGEEAVSAVGDDLRLNPAVVASDVGQFEEMLEVSEQERAAGLYAGPFLDGFFISGAEEFERWAALERERLARAYGKALDQLASEAIAGGDHRLGVDWLRRLAAHEPESSAVAARLMEALAASGDRAGALQVARDHAEHLRANWDTEADPVVTDLARRLRQEPVPWTRPEGASIQPGEKPTKGTDRKVAWVASAALVLAVFGSWAFWPRPETELTAEEVLAAGADPGIAVLPFTVNDPSLDRWREGMVDLLSLNLDGVPDLRAIDNRTVLARWEEAVPDSARADLATALAVARNTGARYALLGTVVAAGASLRLTAEVYEARGGAKLGQGQVTGSPDSILVLVDRLTMAVLRVLPREGGVLAQFDLAEITTDSLEALKAFLSGEALYRRADFKGAAAAYERAIASDSLFALAWARLNDSCWWGSGSELCERDLPWDFDEYLSRLPARRAEMIQAKIHGQGLFDSLREMVRKYPDDPDAWYQLGDRYTHFGGTGLVDRAEGDRALEHAIALAPTTSAEPYIHLIEHAFADADSARVARLLDVYERLTRGSGLNLTIYRLAFALGLADRATRARANAALDTVPTETLAVALEHLGNPRLHGASRGALGVLLERPDRRDESGLAFGMILYPRGRLRAALASTNDPAMPPSRRARLTYRLHQVGMNLRPEELERILAQGAADTTPAFFAPTFLLVGAYAVDRGQWDLYATALDLERARGDSGASPENEGAARALEGYALWKRGQRAEAVRALEAAQQLTNGFEPQRFAPWFGYDVTVRWWLGELMLEVGRPRDAERYFKSITADPFTALRLGKVYEQLGEREKARASYEYAFLSWQDADPELQPRIQEARRALARLSRNGGR